MDIETNINLLQKRISDVLISTQRTLDDITVIAVSKTVGVDAIDEVLNAGFNQFGENRVQELVKKFDLIQGSAIWHMIGRLQRNKVKYIIDKVSLIHSLDNLGLAAEIDKQASKIKRVIPVLVQVNASKETTKSGIYLEDAVAFIHSLSGFKHIRVMGLMTIGPNLIDEESVRPYFRMVKELFDELKDINIPNIKMEYLSMGMTNDYRAALMEGSNMIRIGTAIFGTRKKEE